jgi:2-dehydro-3-deoxy-D-arabinonate dehydratase
MIDWLRTVQYSPNGHTRLVVLDGVGATQGVDVTDQLASGPAPGLAAAIVQARQEQRALHDLLVDLVAAGGEPASVDFDTATVSTSSAEGALGVPVDAPEVWAAGVTYEESRSARELESGDGREIYRRVFHAQRPEVFLKDAGGRRTVPSGAAIAVRGDSTWSVPEPEIGLIIDGAGALTAFTVGNDVSARDIEGDNPLYLPQAKIFASSCALGPVALICPPESPRPSFELQLTITDGAGDVVFTGSTSTTAMRRTFEELVSYVTRYNAVADATVLLTGTGVVPPADLSIDDGYFVEVDVPGMGRLRNPVRRLQA